MRQLLSFLRSRRRRRVAMTGVSLGMAGVLLAACVPGTPGMVGNTANCNTPIVNGHMSMAFFAGHRVEANYSWCNTVGGIKYVSQPAISTPTSNPLGGFYESVHVSRLPALSYVSSYRDEATFDVQQTVFHIGGSQTFRFTIRWDTFSYVQMWSGRAIVYGP